VHQPKHRATRVPTTRRRAATLGTAAFGAVAVGASTFTGGLAQAAPATTAVAFAAPVSAAVPAVAPAAAVPAAAPVSTSALPSVALVSYPTSVVVAARSARRASLMPSAVARRAVAAAASRRGTPYRYGAAGPRAFDCSGLTKWSFAQAGKKIPRTAAAQYRASHKVPKAAKRPGDLIFYISRGRVYHVGVYAGNNRVWVARHSGTRIGLQKIYSRSYAVGRFA